MSFYLHAVQIIDIEYAVILMIMMTCYCYTVLFPGGPTMSYMYGANELVVVVTWQVNIIITSKNMSALL